MEEIYNTEPNENTFNKEEFDSFVKDALDKIKKINSQYQKLFDATEGQQSIVVQIESYIESLKQEYQKIFGAGPSGESKSAELEKKIATILAFHKELLEGDEATKSIKADVEWSQDKITDFYVYLFGGSDGTTGVDVKVKEAVTAITKFHDELVEADGYQEAIEKAHTEIIASYEDLYKNDAQGNSKIKQLNTDIARIQTFKTSVDDEIAPFLKDTKDDITNKRNEVKALLAGASGGSLVEGFLNSKQEYQQASGYKKLGDDYVKNIYYVLHNMVMFIVNKLPVVFDYTLFIFPLLISVSIFIQPEWFIKAFGLNNGGSVVAEHLNSLDFYGRLIISLPLWWISWFGQRSITHKRRLAEEYNHKAQVTKMYLNFSSRETQGSYPLSSDAKEKLDVALIDVIERHPGQVYGKDETILDKLIQLVSAGRGGKVVPETESDEKKLSIPMK